jgi:hypothetical protein
VPEALMAFKRAGADGVLTYFARDMARMLKGQAGPDEGSRTASLTASVRAPATHPG